MKSKSNVILFACAGCSHGGRLAYRLALTLDAGGAGEMSCLAGIAAGKSSFLRKVKNKKVATIDGCTTECSKAVFDKMGIPVDVHIRLSDYGIKKTAPLRDPARFVQLTCEIETRLIS